MTPLAAIEYGGNFEVPPVGELFNFEGWTPFGELLAINRVVLITIASVLIVMALFTVAFRKPTIVPSKVQAAAEAIVQFIREQIALDIIGKEGLKFVPFLTTLFMFIWLNNLFEIIPFVNFPSTSRIALPFFLAVISWLTFVIVGMRRQGAIRYFLAIAFPPGVPKAVYVLLTPIELVSTLILRPFTLMIRLFANMVAGHILLTIVFLAVHAFLVWGPGLPIGIFALVAAPLAIGFELFIGLLQAYIFVILTAVYLAGSIHAEH